MAESKLSARLEEVFTCAVCLLKPTDPKLLQCQHTFCLKCIQAVYDSAIASTPEVTDHVTCPFCNTQMRVPDSGLSELPCDFRANEIVDILNALDVVSDPRQKCFMCKKSATEVLCFDCAKPYCNACFQKHAGNSRFADHVYSSVKARDISKLVCEEHDEFVQTFCLDCFKAVCGVCTMTEHNTHNFQEFTRSQVIGSAVIPNNPVTFLRATDFQVSKRISQIPGLIDANRERNIHIKASIRKHKLELFEYICEREDEILSRLDKEQIEYEKEMSDVNTMLVKAKESLGLLEQQHNTIKSPMTQAPHITLLNKEALTEKITENISDISDRIDKPLAVGTTLSFKAGYVEVYFGALEDDQEQILRLSSIILDSPK